MEPTGTVTPVRQNLWLMVLVLLCSATWALEHGYVGLRHDAILYSLQGLARLHTDLANDVFLRFGSQDQYSLFGALYALAIKGLGLEPAAAILTFTSQVAVILCATLLLRQIAATAVFAGLGVVVLIATDGIYGSRQIFSCIEPCLTPRMFAEALVLAGLAAAWSARPALAWALVAMGMAIHPVMAAPGLMALLFLYFGRQRPRLMVSGIGAGLLLLWAAGGLVPQGRWGTFDPDWLAIVRERSPFVFLSGWSLDDWGRAAIPLATLAIGTVVLVEQRARTLCQIALYTALTGLVLTLVACDAAKLVIFTQLQPWRWQWLAVMAAALLLPSIAAAGWHRSRAGKIAVILLAAAWLFESDLPALLIALAAVASLALHRFSDRPELRSLFYGAVGLALIALVNRIALNLQFVDLHFMDWRIPLWIRQAASIASGGGLSVAVILLATWLAGRRYGGPALAVLAVLLLAVGIGQFPDTWRRWNSERFPPELVAQFASWRAQLPADAEVFWSEEPLATWVLLERPSYISVSQSAGVMFSRASAMELLHRAESLSNVVPVRSYLRFDEALGAGVGPSAQQLEQACTAEQLQFVVTGAKLPWAPVARLPHTMSNSLSALRLYRCSDRTG